MKRRLFVVCLVILLCMLAAGLAGMGMQFFFYMQGHREYSEAEQIAGIHMPETVPDLSGETNPQTGSEGPETETSDPYMEAMAEIDLKELQKINRDVIGWISVYGTDISYPLLQTEDNDYYLKYTWRKSRNAAGAIFADCRNEADFSDFNTVIYGHRMNDGSMFKKLHYYTDIAYWEAHPSIYITDSSGVRKYAIFAAYETGTADTYKIRIPDEGERGDYIDVCLEQSVIETGIAPGTEDHIITLSTCTGRGHSTRWVVQAVLTEP